MEKYVGYLTANATVKTFSEDKSVVNFTIAENRTFKLASGEKKEVTRFFECQYWHGSKIAKYLKKGTLVEIEGVTGVRAYIKKETDTAMGVLTVVVEHIQLHTPNGKSHSSSESAEQTS